MQEQSKPKTKYLIGNWKANKTFKEAITWIEKVKKSLLKVNKNLKVVLCPAFIHLSLFKKKLPELALGAQDLSPYGDGAYTGAITTRMLSGLVEYAILGHSERRRYFSETSQQVALKAIQALDNNITPMVAVDKENLFEQMNALTEKIVKKTIVMYEPPEAISKQVGPIGKGEAAPLEKVIEMIKLIRKRYSPFAVIYGGSVKSHNLINFFKEKEIDGVLPGSASLNPEEWLKMVYLANRQIEML